MVKHVSIDEVLEAVSRAYRVPVELITNRGNRHHRVIAARHMAFYLSYQLCLETYESIGKRMGFDHSTVVTGCQKMSNKCAADASLRAEARSLMKELA